MKYGQRKEGIVSKQVGQKLLFSHRISNPDSMKINVSVLSGVNELLGFSQKKATFF
jgi:hypothetical protein